MITVQILINDHVIYCRSAVNQGIGPDGVNTWYLNDDGKILKHRREDGAVKLAIKMLKTIKEP